MGLFCSAERAIAVTCILKECTAAVAPALWADVCAQSRHVQNFDEHVNTEMKRLNKYASTTRLASKPVDPGPLCPICSEPQLVLLKNKATGSNGCIVATEDVPAAEGSKVCDHVACEECWARWAEEHIERSRFDRAVNMRCLGPTCIEPAVRGLWDHACTRSPTVQDLENAFQRRRRLQENVLFPAAMQIDCPQPRCVGLGYMGYDTVMCFMCEHQWAPEHAGEAPPEIDVELVMGIQVKRCPKCSEYIEKNGGCDHMTCRHRGCGHKFWWTTLKPYRT